MLSLICYLILSLLFSTISKTVEACLPHDIGSGRSEFVNSHQRYLELLKTHSRNEPEILVMDVDWAERRAKNEKLYTEYVKKGGWVAPKILSRNEPSARDAVDAYEDERYGLHAMDWEGRKAVPHSITSGRKNARRGAPFNSNSSRRRHTRLARKRRPRRLFGGCPKCEGEPKAGSDESLNPDFGEKYEPKGSAEGGTEPKRAESEPEASVEEDDDEPEKAKPEPEASVEDDEPEKVESEPEASVGDEDDEPEKAKPEPEASVEDEDGEPEKAEPEPEASVGERAESEPEGFVEEVTIVSDEGEKHCGQKDALDNEVDENKDMEETASEFEAVVEDMTKHVDAMEGYDGQKAATGEEIQDPTLVKRFSFATHNVIIPKTQFDSLPTLPPQAHSIDSNEAVEELARQEFIVLPEPEKPDSNESHPAKAPSKHVTQPPQLRLRKNRRKIGQNKTRKVRRSKIGPASKSSGSSRSRRAVNIRRRLFTEFEQNNAVEESTGLEAFEPAVYDDKIVQPISEVPTKSINVSPEPVVSKLEETSTASEKIKKEIVIEGTKDLNNDIGKDFEDNSSDDLAGGNVVSGSEDDHKDPKKYGSANEDSNGKNLGGEISEVVAEKESSPKSTKNDNSAEKSLGKNIENDPKKSSVNTEKEGEEESLKSSPKKETLEKNHEESSKNEHEEENSVDHGKESSAEYPKTSAEKTFKKESPPSDTEKQKASEDTFKPTDVAPEGRKPEETTPIFQVPFVDAGKAHENAFKSEAAVFGKDVDKIVLVRFKTLDKRKDGEGVLSSNVAAVTMENVPEVFSKSGKPNLAAFYELNKNIESASDESIVAPEENEQTISASDFETYMAPSSSKNIKRPSATIFHIKAADPRVNTSAPDESIVAPGENEQTISAGDFALHKASSSSKNRTGSSATTFHTIRADPRVNTSAPDESIVAPGENEQTISAGDFALHKASSSSKIRTGSSATTFHTIRADPRVNTSASKKPIISHGEKEQTISADDFETDMASSTSKNRKGSSATIFHMASTNNAQPKGSVKRENSSTASSSPRIHASNRKKLKNEVTSSSTNVLDRVNHFNAIGRSSKFRLASTKSASKKVEKAKKFARKEVSLAEKPAILPGKEKSGIESSSGTVISKEIRELNTTRQRLSKSPAKSEKSRHPLSKKGNVAELRTKFSSKKPRESKYHIATSGSSSSPTVVQSSNPTLPKKPPTNSKRVKKVLQRPQSCNKPSPPKKLTPLRSVSASPLKKTKPELLPTEHSSGQIKPQQESEKRQKKAKERREILAHSCKHKCNSRSCACQKGSSVSATADTASSSARKIPPIQKNSTSPTEKSPLDILFAARASAIASRLPTPTTSPIKPFPVLRAPDSGKKRKK